MANLIVGGSGLVGFEAVWQAANNSLKVALFEMRPSNQMSALTSG